MVRCRWLGLPSAGKRFSVNCTPDQRESGCSFSRATTSRAQAFGRAGGHTSTSNDCSAKTGDAMILVTTAGTAPVIVRQLEVSRSGLFQVTPRVGAKSLV